VHQGLSGIPLVTKKREDEPSAHTFECVNGQKIRQIDKREGWRRGRGRQVTGKGREDCG
jgi:hypothetical protein